MAPLREAPRELRVSRQEPQEPAQELAPLQARQQQAPEPRVSRQQADARALVVPEAGEPLRVA